MECLYILSIHAPLCGAPPRMKANLIPRFFLPHNSMKFPNNRIIQFLPELSCHRVGNILIDIFPASSSRPVL